MKRQISMEREPELEASQESQAEATALGVICQPDFLRAVTTLKTFLDEFGGEAYIAAYREKFDLEGRKVGKDDVGEWITLGYMFHIESVAKNTHKVTGAEKEKDDRLTQARPLAEEPDHSEADREQLEAIEQAAA